VIGDWRLPIADFDWRIRFVNLRLMAIANRQSPIVMNQQVLKARTKSFALRVMKLVDALPKTVSGRAIGSQLVRAATGVGSNYRACCRARSRAEFIAKIGVVEEEADESAFWMELIIEGGPPCDQGRGASERSKRVDCHYGFIAYISQTW
jgi:four helix bundle protein